MGTGQQHQPAGAGDQLTAEDLQTGRGCLVGCLAGVVLWLVLAVILALIVLSPLWLAVPAR